MPVTDGPHFSRRALFAVAALTLVMADLTGAAPLVPQTIPAGESWDGLQFLGADPQGRVFVLRSETFEVYPLAAEGLGEPIALEPATGFAPAGAVVAASMGSSSGDWLIRAGAYRIQLFRGRKEQPLPDAPWLVQSVLFADGSPVAAVAPMAGPGAPAEREAPLLLQLSGRTWTSLAESDPLTDPRLTSEDPDARRAAYREARWRSTVALAGTSDGRIWVADQFAFRLRELSPAGRLRSTITLAAEPKMEIVERPAEEQEEIRAAAAASGRKLPASLPGLASKPNERILGLTVGRDGNVYLLTHTAGRVDVARWDPLRLALERTPLAKSTIPVSTLSLASGRHALFVATLFADGGRWQIPWETLEAAEWEPFEETVYLNSSPVPARPSPSARAAERPGTERLNRAPRRP